MSTLSDRAPVAAFALSLTQQLLACAGITPGMRVLALGRDVGELALLLAERVGAQGRVIGVHEDREVVQDARSRAAEEGFEHVEFLPLPLSAVRLEQPVDAVVARFFLMWQTDPVVALQRAAGMLHDGGRLIVQEWHYDSVSWSEISDWPYVPLYRRFVRWSIEAMRREQLHSNVGLRLPNLFAQAGLPLPEVRSELQIVNGPSSLGYAFFETIMREWVPATERHGVNRRSEIDMENFADRLKAETNAAGGHLFLPLQIGAWTRVER